MVKNDLTAIARVLAERHNMKKQEVNEFLKAFVATINDALDKDRQLKIKGLGTFKIQTVSARQSVDVNTGERILLEEREKISFTPDKSIAEQVNKPFAQFTTTPLADDVDFSEIDKKYDVQTEGQEVPVNQEEPEEAPVVQEVQDEVPVVQEPEVPETPEIPEQPVEPEVPETPEQPEEPKEAVAPIAPVVSEIPEQPAEPEIPETPVEPAQPVEPEVLQEELQAEPQEESQAEPQEAKAPSRRPWKWVALLLVCLLLGGGAYWLSRPANQHYLAQVKALLPQKSVSNNTDSVQVVPADTVQVISEEERLEQMNEYPGVKLGAWRIVGIADTVVALPGQSFRGIAKAHLGAGMECYVEAANNGKKTVEVGDTLFIPQLKNKKALKKLNVQP